MPSTLARRIIFVFLSVVLVFSSVRVAYGNPAPTTLQANNITATSAVLVGVIVTNSIGQNTEWWFLVREGAASNSQGEVVCPQSLGVIPGNIPQTGVTYDITGLKPSTTYFFNLFARWSGYPNQAGVWKSFTTLPGSPKQYTIDWALSNPSLSSPSPKVGDLVAFGVIVTQLSSNWPGSLTVGLILKLDGNAFGTVLVYSSEPGPIPVGITKTAWTEPWTATAGAHLVTWQLVFEGGDETAIITDPFPNNSQASLQFSVDAATSFDFSLSLSPSSISVKQGDTASFKILLTYSDPSYSGTVINIQLTGLGPGMDWQTTTASDLSITTLSSTPLGSYPLVLTGSANGVTHQSTATLIVTLEQITTQSAASTQPSTTIQSVTQVETTTQTIAETTPVETIIQTVTQSSTEGTPAFTIRQNDLLTIGLIAAVAALIAVIALRRPRRAPYTPPPPPTAVRSTAVTTGFCANCGAPLKPDVKFCGSCGQRTE